MPKYETKGELISLDKSEENYEPLNSPTLNNDKKCTRLHFLVCFICSVFVSGGLYSSYLYYEEFITDSSESDNIFI
jgi:hypothetical protein